MMNLTDMLYQNRAKFRRIYNFIMNIVDRQDVKRMMDKGLAREVKNLLAEDKPLSRQARSAIGYAEIINYLEARMGLDDAVERIKINTRRLAKSQRTWFKTFKNVQWLDISSDELPQQILTRTLRSITLG